MTTNFTPGPWEVVSKAGYPAVFGGNRILCSPGGYSISELRADKQKAAEIVANANLIAAAPDLFHALLEVVLDMDHAGKTSRAKRRAEAILAKAQGGAA